MAFSVGKNREKYYHRNCRRFNHHHRRRRHRRRRCHHYRGRHRRHRRHVTQVMLKIQVSTILHTVFNYAE